jgi:hypothetical protein
VETFALGVTVTLLAGAIVWCGGNWDVALNGYDVHPLDRGARLPAIGARAKMAA